MCFAVSKNVGSEMSEKWNLFSLAVSELDVNLGIVVSDMGVEG